MNITRIALMLGLASLVAAPVFAAKPTKKMTAAENHWAQTKRIKEEGIKRMGQPALTTQRTRRSPKMLRPDQLALSDKVTKRHVRVERIVDGMVFYYAGDTTRLKGETLPQWNTRKRRLERYAILSGDTAKRIRGKVGQVITLHMRTDGKGFAYLVDITR